MSNLGFAIAAGLAVALSCMIVTFTIVLWNEVLSDD